MHSGRRGSEIKVRPMYELSGFGESMTSEVAEAEERTREKLIVS